MLFEVGKRYRHIGTNERMYIIARAEQSMIYYTPMLIGEKENGELVPVGIGTDYSVNWEEVE